MKLENKSILIVSPQSWHGQKMSKHHYATELAKRQNRVFFLEPPINKLKSAFDIREVGKNISVISLSFFIPKLLKFHLRVLYNVWVNWVLTSQIHKFPKIDIIWCFDPNVYSDFSIFKPELVIFHPVDFISESHQLQLARKAKLCLTVSQEVLAKLKKENPYSHLLNHGLSGDFIMNQPRLNSAHSKLKFAYVGNLLIRGLDYDTLVKVIEHSKLIQFDFFGNSDIKVGATDEQRAFINFLRGQENVSLKGIITPQQLSVQLNEYDGFLLCYDNRKELNSGSNSHKILEYLSFGKVVISSKIEFYRDKELIEMVDYNDNSDYLNKFIDITNNMGSYNSKERFDLRRSYALQNSYSNHINTIEHLIQTSMTNEI